jgi:hypothetical protein
MEASDATDRSSASLAIAFRQDLNAIGRALIQAFGLQFAEEVPNLSEPLPRWFDFRFRYVEPKSRFVVFSDRIPKMRISQVPRPMLSFIERVASGQDINPYQGRGLKLRHDTSGVDHSKRTDYLFAAWNILHFHLSDDPIPAGQYFSKAADWLAFAMVDDKQFVLIDVLRHPDLEGFSDPTLLETVARCWPEYMEQFRIKLPTSGERPLTRAEIHHLRSRGVNAPFVYNGHSYIGPGGGYTSAGTTMNTTIAMAHIVRTFEPLANTCWMPEGPYRSHCAVSMVADPRFSLRLYEGGLGIYEEHSRTLFVQPPGLDVVTGDLRWLSNLVVPPWALSEVVRQKDRFDDLFCECPSRSP